MTNNKPSLQEMIDAIYEKIARKDLSFGCRMKSQSYNGVLISIEGGDNSKIMDVDYYNSISFEDINDFEIIGHPVMIGDVMDFIERNFPDGIHCIKCKKGKILSDNFNDDTIFYCDNKDCEFLSKFYGDEAFCNKMELYDGFWEEKRKPIEEQSSDCIEYVYDLIK